MLDFKLEFFRLIVDSGLLVLIWLVQLVIYPGFKYYNIQDLSRWHKKYTGRITIVVLPLMFSQLILSVYFVITNLWTWYAIIYFILVLSTWVTTFTIFVPLHQKIDVDHVNPKLIYVEKLIKYNWWRTAIWSFIFILTASNIFT